MAAAMITLVKTFTYRGNPEEWSNSYHLDGTPADRAAWISLANGLFGDEAQVYGGAVHGARALCYDNSDNAALFTLVCGGELSSVAGVAGAGGNTTMAGDEACVLSWNTGLNGSTGKAIWLRKYYHGAFVQPDPNQDYIGSDTATALTSLGNFLLGNDLGGGVHYADKNGRRPDGPIRVDEFVTTRTLKRRGKRP